MATTATTVGYGDILAYSKIEKGYMVIVQLGGIMIFSILSGLYDQFI
jgi:hypothetical protein